MTIILDALYQHIECSIPFFKIVPKESIFLKLRKHDQVYNKLNLISFNVAELLRIQILPYDSYRRGRLITT